VSRSSTERAGLAIGREHVGFARLAASGLRVSEAKLATPLFRGAPSPQAKDALAEALRSLASDLKRRFVPLHVSVPDAAVRWATFELDQMPRTQATRLELARFRFERQGGSEAACACQPLGRDIGKPLLFGMAIDAAWRRCIAEALAKAGLRAWTLNPNACRQFNRFHERLTQASGALVALAPDAWSLWLWDERGRPRYVRARWRVAREDHTEIAQEVERSILAYVQAGAERDVARVFIAANGEIEAMAAALDGRLREPCSRLQAEPVAVAAALEQ
jgi:hypothetical protein